MIEILLNFVFSSVQSLSRVRLFATPWIAARQASLSVSISRGLLRLTSIESVMPSNHLILCRPLLLLPSVFPSIRVFSNESALHIRWPKYWSFSFNISPSHEYYIGTCNVRSMNQGKLEVVKQEMTRVNINILGSSELKWTAMGEFKSDDHYIYNCGQECLRRNEVALIVNKSPKCSAWVQSQKWHNDLCSFPRQTIQNHSNPRLCPN